MSVTEITYTSGLILLKDIVLETLDTSNSPLSNMRRFTQAAVRIYLDLRLHIVREGEKQKRITIDTDINAVDFPNDFVDFRKIGVIVNGKVVKLSPTSDAVITTTESAGQETLDSDYGEGLAIPTEKTVAFYARGGSNSKGFYTIEWDKRRIRLFNVTESYVSLTYLSSGISLDGDTYIPVMYAEAMESGILWWMTRLDKNLPMSQRQYYENQYMIAKRKLRNLQAPRLDEIEQVILKTIYATAKR